MPGAGAHPFLAVRAGFGTRLNHNVLPQRSAARLRPDLQFGAEPRAALQAAFDMASTQPEWHSATASTSCCAAATHADGIDDVQGLNAVADDRPFYFGTLVNGCRAACANGVAGERIELALFAA